MSNRKDSLKEMVVSVKAVRSKLASFHRIAGDQHGIFQNFQSNHESTFPTRQDRSSMRGSDTAIGRDTESLYNLSPEHKPSEVKDSFINSSLSTRYSPDRVGVQARRIGDGVVQDPYTNKIYDYNEGFKMEDGREFPGGSTGLQTHIMNLANRLDTLGLIKEADLLDGILKKAQEFASISNGAGAREDALTTKELGALMQAGHTGDKLKNVDRSTPWVREVLGLDAADSSSALPSTSPIATTQTSARVDRPLTTMEIVSLIKADRDTTSSYKLDPDRLASLTNANLTQEEALIVDGA